MSTEPVIRDGTLRVTITTIQHTEIWVSGRAATRAPTSPPPAADWIRQVAGRELVEETVRVLAGMLPWLAVAGAGALARRAQRAALPGPGHAPRRMLPSRKALPRRAGDAPA
jgi:hypothetical protein